MIDKPRRFLVLGGVAALLVAAIGGLRVSHVWDDGSALGEARAMRRFGVIVGIEVAVAAVGALGIALRESLNCCLPQGQLRAR